jgi:hypothetical protein
MKTNRAKVIFQYRNGVPLLPRRPDGKTVTMEMVNRLRDEDEFLDPITGRRTYASGAEKSGPVLGQKNLTSGRG